MKIKKQKSTKCCVKKQMRAMTLDAFQACRCLSPLRTYQDCYWEVGKPNPSPRMQPQFSESGRRMVACACTSTTAHFPEWSPGILGNYTWLGNLEEGKASSMWYLWMGSHPIWTIKCPCRISAKHGKKPWTTGHPPRKSKITLSIDN